MLTYSFPLLVLYALISEWQAAFIKGINLLRFCISASSYPIYFSNFWIRCSLFPDEKNDLNDDFPDCSLSSSSFESILFFSSFCLVSYVFFLDSTA